MKDVVVSISFEIELNELGYEGYLYGSELRIHLTDLAYNKMDGNYREALYKYIENETVILDRFSQDEFTQLACEYYNSPGKTPITLEDYSEVWSAKSKGYIYMSSDRKLSAVAMEDGFDLYEFMQLVSTSITSSANKTSTVR